jgi:Mrp family chromosome partitioning ATPase
MLLAVLLARLSPRVMGDFEVEDILGQQMVGEMARVREFRASPRAAFGNLPTDVMAVTNELCVRIESSADDDTSLTVVVVGSRRRAGTSTLAASIAARFAMNGLQVLLIDADRRHPQLSSFEFATSERPDEREARKQLDRSGPLGAVKSTPLPRLSVASVRAFEGAGPMRRQDVIDLLDAGTSIAQVVVVDGGPLLASASTVQLTRVASAIVLAVPHRESVRSLAELAKELRDRTVFAVWTPSRRGFAAPPRTPAPDAVRDTPEPVETDDIEATVGSRK